MVRVLSDGDVAAVLDLESLLPVVAEAFRKQGRGEVERPERPHFPVGTGLVDEEPLGTGLVMPAYIHGADHYATKLVGVHEGNPERGLPTVNAQLVLTEAATGLPVMVADATRITNARTGCIGGLAARELAENPVTLGLVGAGTQARWQARAVAAATDLAAVRVYSPSDSRQQCAADLRAELGIDSRAVDSPTAAVEGANVVVTATTATTPVFPEAALDPGTLVIAVGAYTAEMQELEPRVFERAEAVFADVPEEVATIGDAAAADLGPDAFLPFATLFEDTSSRPDPEELVVVESVGTAVLDAATGSHVYDTAVKQEVGTEIELAAAGGTRGD